MRSLAPYLLIFGLLSGLGCLLSYRCLRRGMRELVLLVQATLRENYGITWEPRSKG